MQSAFILATQMNLEAHSPNGASHNSWPTDRLEGNSGLLILPGALNGNPAVRERTRGTRKYRLCEL